MMKRVKKVAMIPMMNIIRDFNKNIILIYNIYVKT